MLEHLDWAELLRRWSQEALDHADDLNLYVTPAMRSSGWIGEPPAPPGAVAAAEHRIGRPLPPSYRSFVELADGWPVTSFNFGAVRPLASIGWVADLDPYLIEIYEETTGDLRWPEDSIDGPPLLRRSLLLSTGTDNFLLDPGRVDAAGEWAACNFTNWNPGAGKHAPSFRAGLEGHYASFVRFEAPDSVTHAEVAAQVESAYLAALRGDRSQEHVLSAARFFGSVRADALEFQVHELAGQVDGALSIGSLAFGELGPDPALLDDLLPLFVAAALDPRTGHSWALDLAISRASEQPQERLRTLAAEYQRTGGLDADFSYAPAFAAAVSSARALLRQGRDEHAFAQIVDGLPSWQPLSPLQLAPMGLLWDHELASLIKQERRLRVLYASRGEGTPTSG